MTNIYILSKSYHDFMFVFCCLFIGGQKNNIKKWSLCKHTHTCTHAHKHVFTLNMRHEYSTQWNALFCIILLYKMLEVHVFFKLCRWCNCNGDKCVREMGRRGRVCDRVNGKEQTSPEWLKSSDKTELSVWSSPASTANSCATAASSESFFFFIYKGIAPQLGIVLIRSLAASEIPL